MDGLMTCPAKDQGLPSPGCHLPLPGGDFPSPLDFGVCQLANMMHLDILRTLADFAPVRQKASEQLRAFRLSAREHPVHQDCRLLPAEEEAAEARHQWRLALPLYPDFQARPKSFLR